MKRRDFLRTAGGATAAATAATAGSGAAAAAEGGGGGGMKPQFPSYVSGAKGGTYKDLRGQSSVTIEVGADPDSLAFQPTKVWIDPGTEVTFDFVTGGHNVVPESQPQGANWQGTPGPETKKYDEGYTYSHTFDTGGMYTYYCQPHVNLGMKGAIAVGGEVPTVSTGGGQTDPQHMGVPFQAHYVGIATVLMVCVSLVFTFFLLKYGESPHASGGNN